MQISILTANDLAAAHITAHGCSPQRCNFARLVASLAETTCPASENFSATVACELLPFTYRTNPSLFSRCVLSHAPSFKGCSGGGGSRSVYSPTQINITLTRQPYTAHDRLGNNGKVSIKSQVRQLLAAPPGSKLMVPLSKIPPFMLSHSEQLAYAFFRETGQRIKITKTSIKWIITLKS